MKNFFKRLFGAKETTPALDDEIEQNEVPEPPPATQPDRIGATRRVMPIKGPDAPKIPSQCVSTLKFIAIEGAGPWMFLSPEPEKACAYAKERLGTLLGSEDGVDLPPRQCDKVACLCFYQRQTESRSYSRRAMDRPGERVEAMKQPPPDPERRQGRGRRRTDPK